MIQAIFLSKKVGRQGAVVAFVVRRIALASFPESRHPREIDGLDVPSRAERRLGLAVCLAGGSQEEGGANGAGFACPSWILPKLERGRHGTNHFQGERVEGGGVVELEDAEVGGSGGEELGGEGVHFKLGRDWMGAMIFKGFSIESRWWVISASVESLFNKYLYR